MSRCITICPIGFVEKDVLDRIIECIENLCGVACQISQGMGTPHYAYNEKRSQYHSKAILKRLLLDQRQDSIRLIGVTNVDLYVPILKYVYGLAQIDGHCAVISLHRLRPEFYDEPPNPDLLMDRAEKTVLHELGHSMGLTHCIDRRCIMYSSTRIGDTDHKNSRFCPTCSDLFRWYLGKCLEDDNA